MKESGGPNVVHFAECEENLRQLIKNSFDIIGLVDANGISHYISESCEKILGYKQSELTGVQVVNGFVHPDDIENAWEGLRNIIQNYQGSIQYRYRHKDGNWVYLEAYGSNQINNPAIKSVVLNVRDITERKNAEKALMDSKQYLSELNATKDRFFSIISHDLRSPFSSIIGFSDILVEQIHENDYQGIEEYARIIQSASQQAMDLLTNLLEWSRTQSERMAFSPSKIELSPVIDGVVGFFKETIQQKSISIVRKIPKNLHVMADVYMLKGVLRNLISNGLKFTRPGGEIIVRAWPSGSQVVVSVTDNGMGIKEEDLKKLFRVDYTHSTPGTNHEKGSGLGLLLCKEFVEMHGGEIWAESQIEKGTVFYFTMPLEEK